MTLINNPSQTKDLRRRLRSEMPEAEQKMWYMLRGRSVDGYKFRRQHGIGPYVVDFYCPEIKLVVEVDGDNHFTPEAETKDEKRSEYIRSCGMNVIRFTNIEVRLNPEAVVDDIYRYIQEHHPRP